MSSSNYVILLRCITVLYLCNRVKGNWTQVKEIVAETLGLMKIPVTMLGEEGEGEKLRDLKGLVEWMHECSDDIEFQVQDILSRVKLNVKDDPSLLHEIELSLTLADDADKARNRIRSIISELNYENAQVHMKTTINKLAYRINNSSNVIERKEAIRDLQERLAHFTTEGVTQEKKGFVGRLTLSDEEGMVETFTKAKESVSSEGVMRTGLVGLNRMLGVGGFRRGELVNFGALTHNYKTGILNDLLRHIPLYNKPFMWDMDRKPLVLRASFENKQEQDLPIIYRSLVEQSTGEKIDLSEVDPVKAARYVKDRLSVNGYEVAMECYDPNNFTVYDLLDVFNYYEAKGYEIHCATVDYLELIASKKKDRIDEAINDVFEVSRNHCFPRGITLITAHQLSTEAVMLQRDNPTDFVKRISDGAYYRNTKSLNTKLDCEILMHIEKRFDQSFLTFARGKHRGGDQTPFAHRYFAYHFQEVGGIVDDVLKPKPDVIYDIGNYIREKGIGLEEDGGAALRADDMSSSATEEW